MVSDEVIDIFSAAGLKRPDIGVLSDEFLEDVRHMKERNLAVELLERLLKGEIKSRFKTNVVQSAKFSELLQQSLTRYRNRAIETAQVIEELIEMAKKFQEAAQRGEQLGLNADEMAFYDALATNEAAVRELGDATLKKIAVELTVSLRRVGHGGLGQARGRAGEAAGHGEDACCGATSTRRTGRKKRPRPC